MTRTEWCDYISLIYHAEAERPWEKYPENLVFRHAQNQKWFALMMIVSREKLGLPGAGPIEILNLKCDPLQIGSFRQEAGVFPAYHMNKANWLSVALDGTVSEERVKLLLDISFDLTAPKCRRRTENDRKRKNAASADV